MDKHIKNFFPFPEFRDGQDEVMDEIEEAFKKHDTLIVQAPTGVGKSPISDASIKYFGNGHILTNQISLQTQYVNDFDVKKVSGRANFNCLSDPDVMCSEGLCIMDTRYDCPYKPSAKNSGELAASPHCRDDIFWSSGLQFKCEYWEQKTDAINSDSVIHNYSYFLNEVNYVQDFGGRNILICDEGHNIETKLLDFNKATLTRRDIEDLQQKFNKYGTDIRKWTTTLQYLAKVLYPERVKKLSNTLKRKDLNATERSRKIAEKNKFENLITKFNFIIFSSSVNPEDWVITYEYSKEKKGMLDKVIFNPLVIDKYADAQLFQYGDKVLIMSATIMNPKIVAQNLGISDYQFIDIPQKFDPSQKPIYHLNVAKLDKDGCDLKNPENELQNVVDAIDILLDLFAVKGIIHTTTFDIAKFIKSKSRHANRILTHTTENREYIIDKHINSPENTIICSPSMTEGLDLVDDLSRIQILVKVPYPSLSDAIILGKKKRDELNRVPFVDTWYNWKTTYDIVQAYGRSIRSPDDFAYTFTIDDRFEGFCKRNHQHKVKTEIGAFIREDTLFHKDFTSYVRPTNEFIDMYKDEFKILAERNPRNTDWLTQYL